MHQQAYLAQIYNGLFDLGFPNKIYVIIGGADLHSAFKKYLIGTKFSWEAQIYSGFSAFKKNLIGTKFDLGFSWKVFIIILRQHRLNLFPWQNLIQAVYLTLPNCRSTSIFLRSTLQFPTVEAHLHLE
ncbi:hypothetical protein ACJX0J_025242, partial [Zea mays]